MNSRTYTGVIRSISREQEVLHQCDSPVSHFTLESHTSSTRDPTRKNFARGSPLTIIMYVVIDTRSKKQ
jgi:hypothetical protein